MGKRTETLRRYMISGKTVIIWKKRKILAATVSTSDWWKLLRRFWDKFLFSLRKFVVGERTVGSSNIMRSRLIYDVLFIFKFTNLRLRCRILEAGSRRRKLLQWSCRLMWRECKPVSCPGPRIGQLSILSCLNFLERLTLFSWCLLLLMMVMMALWMKRASVKIPVRLGKVDLTSGMYWGENTRD